MSESERPKIDRRDLTCLGSGMAGSVNQAADDLAAAVEEAKRRASVGGPPGLNPGDGARRGIHKFGQALNALADN